MELKTILIILAILLLVWVGRNRVCREGMSTVERTLNITRDMVLHGDIVAQDGKPLGGAGDHQGPTAINKIVITNQYDWVGHGAEAQMQHTGGYILLRRVLAIGSNNLNLLDVGNQKMNEVTPGGTPYNDRIWEATHVSGQYKIKMRHVIGQNLHDVDHHRDHDEHMRNIINNSYHQLAHSKPGQQRVEIWFEDMANNRIAKEIKQVILITRHDTGHMKNFIVICENDFEMRRIFQLPDHMPRVMQILDL